MNIKACFHGRSFISRLFILQSALILIVVLTSPAHASSVPCSTGSATISGFNPGSDSGVWSAGEQVFGPKGILGSTGATKVATVIFSGVTPLSARIYGPGNIQWGSESAYGRDVTLTNPSLSTTLSVFNDGMSGSSTIIITALIGGVSCTYSKSLSFYGPVTSLIAEQGLYVADASGGSWGCGLSSCGSTSIATIPAATILATDSNGIPVPYLELSASASSTINFSNSVNVAQRADSPGIYNSDITAVSKGKSGESADYVWASGSVVSNSLNYKLGNSLASVEFNTKPSEFVGQLGTMSVTLKDSSSNKPYDAFYDLILRSTMSLTASLLPASPSTVNQNSATTKYLVLNGTRSWTFFNPIVEGEVSLVGSTFGGISITDSWKVENRKEAATAFAAQEATEAANAAFDAASIAAQAADAATIAAQDATDYVEALSVHASAMINILKQQVIALTNLILKIQKRLKA